MSELTHKNINHLYTSIREVLLTGRDYAYKAVNFAMVQSYWQIGKLITEEELNGGQRAEYGKYLVQEIAIRLTTEFGRGFDKSELYKICRFYKCSPIVDALRPQFVIQRLTN